jgi:hypothetical protein
MKLFSEKALAAKPQTRLDAIQNHFIPNIKLRSAN